MGNPWDHFVEALHGARAASIWEAWRRRKAAGGHEGWDTSPMPDLPNDQPRYTPIAFVRSPYAHRIDAPHQPTVVDGTQSGEAAEALIEFVEGIPTAAFSDLAGFERIWLVFVFHRSEGWKAQVRPPRGGGKRSVLATRSPHRPNPIGLSAVELIAVDERVLRVRGIDLLDGTPILDIKPYVPYADAFVSSRAGWIDAIDADQGQHSAPGPKRPRSK
jgi:tRNA-Thr(GGU) m(6)t(6)A37 methyltransferase TsaA